MSSPAMRNALITGLLALTTFANPNAAHAADCGLNTSGNNVCVHRVVSSTKDPTLKVVYYSVDSGQMHVTAVDCSDSTAYLETQRTWYVFGPGSAFHRACANWSR